MKKIILLASAICSGMIMANQGTMTIESVDDHVVHKYIADPEFDVSVWNMYGDELINDLPPIYIKAWGQERHVSAHSELVVNGAHQVCFRNYTQAKEHAWYRFEVRGFGKEAHIETDFYLPPHSAICASAPPYFNTNVGNAGRYSIDVFTFAKLNNGQTHQTKATGTVYVGG